MPQSAAARADKIKALAKQFGKWHGISSLINLGTLVAAVGHGYWLAGGEAHRSCCAHLSLCCQWKRLVSEHVASIFSCPCRLPAFRGPSCVTSYHDRRSAWAACVVYDLQPPTLLLD